MKLNAVLMCVFFTFSAVADNQTQLSLKEKMIQDVTFIASDQLEGRANFSQGIEAAGHFIQKRFSEIGLKPLSGAASMFQPVSVYGYSIANYSVLINDKKVEQEQIAVVSTAAGNNNYSLDKLSVTYVGSQQQLKDVVSGLNQKGGNHLVVVETAQTKWFTLYRNYFARGLTKAKKPKSGTIILVLADDIEVQSLVANINVSLETKTLFNVVGQLNGDSLTHENVLYSAHYDHLGVAETGEDKIYNGADDNASGTATVINLAERFVAANNNQRTLIFAAFAGEEIGGFGSKHFSNYIDSDSITAMVNIEMVGKPSKFGEGVMWMTGPNRSNLLTLINESLKPNGMEVHPDPYPQQKLFYRSDNASLAKFGVPAHSFSTTQLDKDQHYHQVTDEVKTLNLDSMFTVINNIEQFGIQLNLGLITPSRIEPLEDKPSGKIY